MIRISSIKTVNSRFDAGDFTNGVMEPDKLRAFMQHEAAGILKISEKDITNVSVVRHSIDARKKPDIVDIFTIDVKVRGNEQQILKRSRCKSAAIVKEVRYSFPKPGEKEMKHRPVVIGAGPCGLFAAYELAMHGYRPVLIERGKSVDNRQADVEEFWATGVLNTQSNVQFGEGGAGAFSDGKLNTMVKDKDGRGRAALRIFVDAGAPEEILYESKPHIGTDELIGVVRNMRETIRQHGGTVLFETQVTGLVTEKSGKEYITGINIRYKQDNCDLQNEINCIDIHDITPSDDGTVMAVIDADTVVLAIGHSARDTFEELHAEGIMMEPKAFAVGLRVEHRQEDIDMAQYGVKGCDTLPPSPYKVVHNTDAGRGVYSFCMCPGGYVVNASSEEESLCVNGMSYYARDSRNANSAIIVTVKPEDFGGSESDVLAGVRFQRELEHKAYQLGNGRIPVEYFDDYRKAVESGKRINKSDDSVGSDIASMDTTDPITIYSNTETIHECTTKDGTRWDRQNWNSPCCKGEYVFADVHEILPDYINESIVEGMGAFGHMIRGFDRPDALMEGVEARTSSPVRITRGDDLQSVSVRGLYPCGEGAGYAGGIMSAAMDGMKIAAEIASSYLAFNHTS